MVRIRNRNLSAKSSISAVDLFCGAGGLTHGLIRAGIKVEAGIDNDEQARHAYIVNNPGAEFKPWEISSRRHYTSIAKLFDSDKRYRLLAGCAPCQPFSKLTNGKGRHKSWGLLKEFGRFVDRIRPELVTMENVPELAGRGRAVLDDFIKVLVKSGYKGDPDRWWRVVECDKYGVPQQRRRLVLIASRLGEIEFPVPPRKYLNAPPTVRKTIGSLPRLEAGEEDHADPLHVAARLSDLNIRRVKATPPDGGTQRDWPEELLLDCHRKESGKSYYSIYGRMYWDKPSPTMTTLCTGLGNGRFGHPEQHRAITLREAALLQSFPGDYEFWPPEEKLNKKAVARFIGNAVPPRLGEVIGKALLEHIGQIESAR